MSTCYIIYLKHMMKILRCSVSHPKLSRHQAAMLALQNGVDVKPLFGYLRPHIHPDAAGRGTEGRRILANEYVMHRQTP